MKLDYSVVLYTSRQKKGIFWFVAIFGPCPPIAFTRLQTLTDSLNMPVFLGSMNAELIPEYFHAAYIFGCIRNTAISANKPKYTFLLLTSV